MAMTDPTESDPTPSVISISTTDFESSTNSEAMVSPPTSQPDDQVSVANAPDPGTTDSQTGETEIWQDRYAFGNFVGRFLIGFALIGLCLYFLFKATYPPRSTFYPLVYLSGIAGAGFWLWLVYQICRARFGHRYRLTSSRLFVTSGIFRRQDDMMELAHLKEVGVVQEGVFGRICQVGNVVVTSNVQGAPTLILAGVNQPQVVSDLIYRSARG